MSGDFLRAHRFVAAWEGGLSDRPLADDPGGLTRYGITQATYDRVQKRLRLPKQSVASITPETARLIYWHEYWLVPKCEEMPWPLSLAYHDAYVQHGRAPQLLQEALNACGAKLAVDGVIGPKTLAAAASKQQAERHAEALIIRRLLYYPTLSNWKANAFGWVRRMVDLHRVVLGANARGS